jgi:ABC-type glycerol-3-phosphate transport system substrate-binding protein
MNKLTIVVVIVAVLIVIAGITAGVILTKKTPTKTSVVFSGWVSSGAEYTFDLSMVKTFNSMHSNISVVFEPITSNYYPSLTTKFATNTAPGVFYMENDALPAFAKAGDLLNLTPVLSANTSYNLQGFVPNIVNTFNYKGGLFAAPKDWNPLFIYFNKWIFNQEHVQYPSNNTVWNWTTMVSTLTALKHNESLLPGGGSGYYPMVVGPQFARILAFMHQAGGQWINPTGTGASSNSAGLLRAIEFWYGLYTKGLAGLNTNLSAGWNGGDFATGKVGMVMSGGWTVPVATGNGSFFKASPQYLGYYHTPSNVQNATMMFNVGLAVNSHLSGTKKWAAEQFVQYFTGPTGEKQWVSLGLALPSRTSILQSSTYAAEQPILAYAGSTEFPYAYGWNYNTTNFSVAESHAHTIIASMFAGKLTALQAYQQILAETNSTLAGSSSL